MVFLIQPICWTKTLLKLKDSRISLKDFKQMQENSAVAFKPSSASVKAQLTEWISEEISYLETKNRLLSVMPALKDAPTLPENEKLTVSVSVDVLALFPRAAKDSKFILNKNMTDMFKYLL